MVKMLVSCWTTFSQGDAGRCGGDNTIVWWCLARSLCLVHFEAVAIKALSGSLFAVDGLGTGDAIALCLFQTSLSKETTRGHVSNSFSGLDSKHTFISVHRTLAHYRVIKLA